MSKDAFYFQHDYEATNDPKLQALIGEFGATGYGIYWRIVEMLHSEESHKLPHKNYIVLAIAKQMLTDAKQINGLLDYAIKECELFGSDGVFFWSDRVFRNIERRAEISGKRSIAGKLGAIAKQRSAKPSKEKKRKENESKEDNTPTLPEFLAYCKTLSIYNSSLDFQIEAKYNAWKENKWKDGNNKLIKNWKTKVQNTMPYFKTAYVKPEPTGRVTNNDWKKAKAENDKKLAEQGVWDGKLT